MKSNTIRIRGLTTIISMMLVLFVFTTDVFAERLKDITSIAGIRTNQLVGYGLVVGLDGTGDKTVFTTQSLKSMLQQLGVTIPPGVNPKSKNVAAVSSSGRSISDKDPAHGRSASRGRRP